ncbi:DNA-binding transcriptional LysR family regulator [Paenibacillus phyllosphaerae]|uniref:DNA-binding transcriptional LysR family regulator n=1 Tax=Paenibacillus phyllosphaerae TaxID=274593 RepID=A0A7W5FMP0_9BACL|nr:LysR family transcriptional regulator [Paenibacillus phyllosphaerae]MBB3110277.1 DNA-binding transcriptional LysR family regulator [Paenibacillus phyllosphaerae]
MESGDLRVFQTVAREGTITRAAQRLGYVQSNVTSRIQQLEQELGTQLFVRHNRGMSLSASGSMLLGYADKVIGLLDEAARALSASDEPGGPLRIGSTQTAAAVRLPKLLTHYHKLHPQVLLSVTTGHTQKLIDGVLQFELDGAFISADCDHPELAVLSVFVEEMVIAAAASPNEDQEQLLGKPIIVFTPGCSYRTILEQWIRDKGIMNPVLMEFGTLEAIIGGVSAGLGISLMPKSLLDHHTADGTIASFPLSAEPTYMRTNFITRKDSFQSSALQAFIRELAVQA